MTGQGMVPEQDVIIAFSIKELFVEIRDDIKLMNRNMAEKVDRADLVKVLERLESHDEKFNANDSKWAGLKGYMLGAAVGGGVLSGGMIAGLTRVLGG